MASRIVFLTPIALLLVLVFETSALAGYQETKPSAIAESGGSFFETNVAPIFETRCLACHNESERKGGLSLSQPIDLIEGGLLELDDPSASTLIEVLRSSEAVPALMPPQGESLLDAQVESILEWIKQGADWPKDRRLRARVERDRQWWSWQPLESPPVPKLAQYENGLPLGYSHGELANPIDRFVAARLQSKGLRLSLVADRRTLIRRLYYDLTGLPPSPAEVEAFQADPDPLAYEKLVDQLLASPRYGERWARHWLDVARYGDSHGYDKDKPRPNAWPYRDYVIRAFNEDKPYSRFVREQLAGDILFPDTVDGMVAPGFLAAGPWDFIGHAEVPETKTDGLVARNLDRDDMVSSTLNAFCSLTVQCARCHHHKLDPVSMQDYYRLQAVFAAVDRADRGFDKDPEVAQRRYQFAEQRKLLEAALADTDSQIQLEAKNRLDANEWRRLQVLKSRFETLQKTTHSDVRDVNSENRSQAYGFHSQVASKADSQKWVQVDLGRSVELNQILVWPANEYGWNHFGFPPSYRIAVSNDPDFVDSTVLLEKSESGFVLRQGIKTWGVPELGQPLLLQSSNRRARYVRLTATQLWNRRQKTNATLPPESNDWIFAIAELEVLNRGEKLSVQSVSSLDSIEAYPRWGKRNLVDGVLSTGGWEEHPSFSGSSPTNGFHSAFAKEAETEKWVEFQFEKPTEVAKIAIYPALPVDWKFTPGFGFPLRFYFEALDSTAQKGNSRCVDENDADFPNPGTRPVVFEFEPVESTTFRLTATKLWHRDAGNHALALAELEFFDAAENRLLPVAVHASDSIEAGRWSTEYAIDGYTSRFQLQRYGSNVREWLERVQPLETLTDLAVEIDGVYQAVVPDLMMQREQLQLQLKEKDEHLKSLPGLDQVYVATVHQGSGAFRGRAGLGPRTIRVLGRGDVQSPLEVVQPGAVPLLEGDALVFELLDPNDEGARRVALAEWIVSKNNPLTWRSISNRIWHYHFGVGLVDTPNDFGRGGSLPTHPLLLDWLAIHFRDGTQSWKEMHRLICTSHTYRQASGPGSASLRDPSGPSDPSQRPADESFARAREVDQENRLLWRMNRRRLSAEEIRDTLLFVSGSLRLEMGGPGFQDFVIEQPEHSPHYEYEKHDPREPKTHRRSVYRFIVRSQPQPMMDSLDCADPSVSVASRDETLTPQQALTLLNNPFMSAMADAMASRLAVNESDEDKIQAAYRLILGRSARVSEVQAILPYFREHGLNNFCRMMFNLNELVFLD